MFGDFITLMADQLVNHIAKFRWMYNDTVNLPLVIRTPMGGRRGYGPTHSQTLEKLFMGIPGITVVAPNHLLPDGTIEPGELLKRLIIETSNPVLFVENKLQYLLPLLTQNGLSEFDVHERYAADDDKRFFPIRTLEIAGAPSPVCTIAAYGYMSELCLEAVKKLAYDHEVFCRLVIPTRLTPFHTEIIEESVLETGRLVVAEEGTLTMGWGAELIALVAEKLGAQLKNVSRVGAENTPVPAAATLEQQTLPQVKSIIDTVLRLAGKNG
jgi:pyruvate/2-oxoglutarate/acetoin dehydrogenase E1 component